MEIVVVAATGAALALAALAVSVLLARRQADLEAAEEVLARRQADLQARFAALEDRFVGLLPEVMLGITPNHFAELAAAVFRPKPPPTVSIDHLHMGKVSVREHVAALRVKLAAEGRATFAELVADCEHSIEVIARFLALLDLYKENVILFHQEEALAELLVEWTGGSLEEATTTTIPPGDEEEYG